MRITSQRDQWPFRKAEWDEAAAMARLEADQAKAKERAAGLRYVTPEPGITMAVGPNWSGSVPKAHPDYIPGLAAKDDIHGYLTHEPDGYINFVYTNPQMRRNGIGTKLLDHAGITETGHSSNLTPDGRKFEEGRRRTAMPMLYHHTQPNFADAIHHEHKFHSPYDDYTYFSDKRDGIAQGYGQSVVDVDVPDQDFKKDFEPDPYDTILNIELPPGEHHYRTRSDKIKPEWIKDAATYYHNTDKTDFKLDPKFHPENLAQEDEGDYGPGVFLSKDPELWADPYSMGEHRRAVSFDGPDDLPHRPGVRAPYGDADDEFFVPASMYQLLKEHADG